MPISFTLTDEQSRKIQDWKMEIEAAERRSVGAIGGRYTYEFSPTSLGVVEKVRDSLTNKVLDVTEYGDW